MKKVLLSLLMLFTYTAYGQNTNKLGPYTEDYNAINKWVAVDVKGSYLIGFIYIDLDAGLTLRHGLYYLDVGDDGKLSIKSNNENSMSLIRLNAQNSIDVIILNDRQLSELGLPEEPEWLHFYKPKEESVSNLVKLGTVYNSIGLCEKALIPLLKAYKTAPHAHKLELELIYAYNHLGLYEKALKIALSALSHDSENPYYYYELVFAYVGLGQFEQAEAYFKKGLKKIKNESMRGDMEFNIAYGYFLIRNKAKFDYWSKQAMMHINHNLSVAIKNMQEDWNIDPKTN